MLNATCFCSIACHAAPGLQIGDMLDRANRDRAFKEESFIQRIQALSTMGCSVLLSSDHSKCSRNTAVQAASELQGGEVLHFVYVKSIMLL